MAGTSGRPAAGDLIRVRDHEGRSLGLATFSPTARIAARMLGAEELPEGGMPALIASRVAAARARRAAFGLPSAETTAYRLVNGEGDGLPGVMVDVLGPLASVQLTTAGAERWLPAILDAVGLEQAVVSVPEDSGRLEGIAPGQRFGRGELEEHITFLENGISWSLLPGKGQKTGFYTDQRENRRAVAGLARGGELLDCFCYTGGFALNALRAGATAVVGADSSGPAVSVAAGTARQNGLEGATFHREDVLRFMRGLGTRTFDVVVLDPPKLARRRDTLDDAFRKYRAFNVEGIAHVRPGGFLVSCSCSGLVDEAMFIRRLTDAAHAARRRMTVHRISGAGPDHPTPVALPEARYLITVIASLD